MPNEAENAAVIVPICHAPPDLWGAMRRTSVIVAGTDLTESAGECWDADGQDVVVALP